ncbi:alpha-mannosidase [Cryobacterium frigoriphilum]|uniref:Alpha-mannosidase n=1 Tax=Cryobacterium frigoriphilum TaxID=1259150 RepID=A0A4R9A5W7_9MICO|nr:glycoside hydrolase family 38 C-terminal domain-containing protein [Cryobacterium frigoriphilum]TFD52951.1 alpha-mannosidase [Cryobacterium frigoriphilum]
MHDDSVNVEARLTRFVRERLVPAVHRAAVPLTVTAWVVPGSVTDAPVPFAEAVTRPFTPFAVGEPWGRPWGTVWFHLTGSVPDDWAAAVDTRVEVVVDLGFSLSAPGFQAEGLVYSADGRILKGLESLNRSVPVTGRHVDLYVEAAANPNIAGDFSFAPTGAGDPATAGDEALYVLRQADVSLRDLPVWQLLHDVLALDGLRRELPEASSRRANLLRALERCVDVVDPHDVTGTARAGRAALAGVLARGANASAHRVHAVGHAHIDSAWLWPTRETVRKVARTFSNVLALIEQHPGFVFAASSAQQYAWLKQHYPELFERVRAAVASGVFVPAGGMWVESDTNMPGGESLARQFMHGKAFFLREFGVEPLDVWLPDSFGYSAALPQIVRAAGSRWFLTQKLSWNDTNRFPHHTFLWEGIDGSRLFTHFPPVADYNAQLSGLELARAERLFAEKGHANSSLVPFGWGDGGGGPTEEMLAAAARTADLEGSPTVQLSSPAQFFTAAEAEYKHPPVWSGELYLEFHRGTYSGQARTKRGNRRSEHMLREAELWATTASVRTGATYPAHELERAWQTVLLGQFHDILPGSSIAWVHQEAERQYAVVERMLTSLIETAVRTLAGAGQSAALLNAGPYPLAGVPALGGLAAGTGTGVAAGAGSETDAARASSGDAPRHTPATVESTPAGLVLRNAHVAVTIDADGLFSSVRDLATDRELIPTGARGNLLQLYRDTPNQWDAWDIDAHYRHTVTDLAAAESVTPVDAGHPLAAAVRITRSLGGSTVVETITLDDDSHAVDLHFEIDWHERQKLLKLTFPLDVLAERAASEIQFGHVFRPTHANTSWDAARFETVAHRWIHVGEPGYGVAIANDAVYGHSIFRAPTTQSDARPTTTVQLSLLRAPLYPDPSADQGSHEFRVAIRVGASLADAVAEGYRLNLPLRKVTGVGPGAIKPLLHVDNPAVVVEAVKLAEDGSGDVVVRLYEAHGTRARARLTRSFEAADAYETDLLERPLPGPVAAQTQFGAEFTLTLRPFQLVTLRYSRRWPYDSPNRHGESVRSRANIDCLASFSPTL